MSPLGVFFEAPIVLFALPAVGFYLYWAWKQSYVNFHPLQLKLMLTARALVLLLLVLAAARTGIVRQQAQDGLVFLVDVSASITDKRIQAAQELVQDALLRKRKQTRMAVVTFAAEPRVVPLETGAPPRFARHADGRASNVARAIRHAEGLFPHGTQTHIVIISDGRWNRGDAVAAADEARRGGARISTVVLAAGAPDEVWVRDLLLPDSLRRGEPAELVAVVASTTATKATVSLTDGDTPVSSQPVNLARGDNPVRFEVRPRANGVAKYTVTVSSSADSFPENNQYRRLAHVQGDPRVLVLHDASGEQGALTATYLVDAWRAQGLDVDVQPASNLRLGVEDLAGYDLVVLCEVEPTQVDRLQQGRIESYVRDLGGGLLVVTGPNGLKGTAEASTPFGRMFPLGADPRGERSIPKVALLLVIDRSASMAGQKLEMAKSAALAAVDEVGADGQVGVIAFAADAKWIVEPQPASQKDKIKQEIQSLVAAGGTRLFPALEEAYFKLGALEAGVRHVVILTDGMTTDGQDYVQLVRKMVENHVTVSTVALTSDADRAFLQNVAALGQGRFHYAPGVADVPRIFVQEARTSLDQANRDSAFTPRVERASALVDKRRLEQIGIPQLGGSARASKKSTADVAMASGRGEPLLGDWRYGLGHVAVWTSDATSRWAGQWVTWGGFAPFWNQVARATMRTATRRELGLQLRREGDQVSLEIYAATPAGGTLNDLEAKVVLVDPNGTAQNFLLRQEGPGLYRGTFDLPIAGPYVALPVASSGEVRLQGAWQAVDYPYADEFAQVTDDLVRLGEVATAGGGKHAAKLDDLLGRASPSREPQSLARYLLLLALAFFVLDIFVKRVRLLEREG